MLLRFSKIQSFPAIISPQHFFPNSLALNITCLSCQTPPRVVDAAAADGAADASADSVVVVAQGLGVDILGLQRQTLIDLQQVLYRRSFIHSRIHSPL